MSRPIYFAEGRRALRRLRPLPFISEGLQATHPRRALPNSGADGCRERWQEFELSLAFPDRSGHGDRPFVQQDGSSHDARVAGEAALPGAVGEDRGAWPAGQVLGAVENPAQRGHSAKDLEELPGDMQGLELNGRISTAEGLVEAPLVVERSRW